MPRSPSITVLPSGMLVSRIVVSSGASDTEIKIGQTMAYSGPASAYGVQGLCQVAYSE